MTQIRTLLGGSVRYGVNVGSLRPYVRSQPGLFADKGIEHRSLKGHAALLTNVGERRSAHFVLQLKGEGGAKHAKDPSSPLKG